MATDSVILDVDTGLTYVKGDDPVPISKYDTYTLLDLDPYYRWLVEKPSFRKYLNAEMRLSSDAIQETDWVLQAYVEAWTTQFAYLHDQIWAMDMRLKLAYTIGEDLDNFWGELFDLPRFPDESDEKYRNRIMVETMILTGSGTKSFCEQIIDVLIECPGATQINTYWPATVRIWIKDNKGYQNYQDVIDLINYTIPRMIAAGVEWFLYLPYATLNSSMYLLGLETAKLSTQTYIKDLVDLDINSDILMAKIGTGTLNSDFRIMGIISKQLVSYMRLWQVRDKILSSSAHFAKTYSSSLNVDEKLWGKDSRTVQSTMRIFSPGIKMNLSSQVFILDTTLCELKTRMALALPSPNQLQANLTLEE